MSRKAVVYKISNAAQSKHREEWVLRFSEEPDAKSIFPVMGWCSTANSGNALGQKALRFAKLAHARDYAKKNDIEIEIDGLHESKTSMRKRNYVDNFLD